MRILGLHLIDFAIVIGSLLATLGVGFWVSRGVKKESDFLVGGRKLGPVLQFFLNFGQMTDSNGAPSIATEVYRQGVGGMWIGFQFLFATPFIWFISTWFRRTRLITLADLFVDRFKNKSLATVYAMITLMVSVLTLALGNVVSYKVASAMLVKPESSYTQQESQRIAEFHEYQTLKKQFTVGQLPEEKKTRYELLESKSHKKELVSYITYVQPIPFYVLYTLIVAAYIMMGGLKAAAITDGLQGVLIIVFSVLLIPLGLSQVGGFSGLHQKVPDFMFRLFGSVAMSEYTWYSILAIVVTSLIGLYNGCGPVAASARDENAVRVGCLTGAFAKRFILIAWMFCGLLAVGLFPGGIADPDNTWGVLSFTLLGPGLLGLMISGMLLGHMPLVGYTVINVAALFTDNIYRPLFKDRSGYHYLVVAKLAIAGALACGILVALCFSGIVTIITTFLTFNAFYGTVFFLILYWRRITAWAVAAGLAVWVVLIVLVPWVLPGVLVGFRTNPGFLLQTPARTVQVVQAATSGDVAEGRAATVGEAITKTHKIAPCSLFFEAVAKVQHANGAEALEGIGRFNVENYIMYRLGLPLDRFTSAGIMTTRWSVDAMLPFLMLILFSGINHAVRSFRLKRLPAGGAVVEEVHVSRFYAKMKTPVARSPEEDEKEMALSMERPDRFDHLRLFPGTAWEFTRWSRMDILGFSGCWILVGLILVLLWTVVNVGG
jgi:Na+/proline symporter